MHRVRKLCGLERCERNPARHVRRRPPTELEARSVTVTLASFPFHYLRTKIIPINTGQLELLPDFPRKRILTVSLLRRIPYPPQNSHLHIPLTSQRRR
ncbi:hypothetical protein BV25DRAFT_291801 [Artomyces pyxidatus]|uniref:Uncharacterized protein n=1 Tax=Artomyces pyxidatus TaxID=48021 RepID=A0ACB8SFT8_9AGAM|nr:hypothetical protein BV25DRAFT_291801 [Artomyces pyxidatus]